MCTRRFSFFVCAGDEARIGFTNQCHITLHRAHCLSEYYALGQLRHSQQTSQFFEYYKTCIYKWDSLLSQRLMTPTTWLSRVDMYFADSAVLSISPLQNEGVIQGVCHLFFHFISCKGQHLQSLGLYLIFMQAVLSLHVQELALFPGLKRSKGQVSAIWTYT